MRLASGTYNIYTDGSKLANGMGAGIFCSELDFSRPFKLAEYYSNFQAEVFVFRKAGEIANNAGNNIKNNYINTSIARRRQENVLSDCRKAAAYIVGSTPQRNCGKLYN